MTMYTTDDISKVLDVANYVLSEEDGKHMLQTVGFLTEYTPQITLVFPQAREHTTLAVVASANESTLWNIVEHIKKDPRGTLGFAVDITENAQALYWDEYVLVPADALQVAMPVTMQDQQKMTKVSIRFPYKIERSGDYEADLDILLRRG